MACQSDLTVQIGNVFYNSFSVPQISHASGQGGNRCSFQVALRNGESPPKQRQLVAVVFTDSGGVQEKLFGGMVATANVVQYFPVRAYQVDCRDFTIFTQVQQFNYENLTLETIEFHATRMMDLANATNAEFTRQRLKLSVREPATPLPELPPDTDVQRQAFSVQNVTLDQALTQLCNQFGFRWRVDFGDWLRVDNIDLAVTHIANLILTRNDYPQRIVPFTIRPDRGGNCADLAKWSALKQNLTARETNRVIVARDSESLKATDFVPPDNSTGFDIPKGAQANSVPLKKRTGVVKKFIIHPS